MGLKGPGFLSMRGVHPMIWQQDSSRALKERRRFELKRYEDGHSRRYEQDKRQNLCRVLWEQRGPGGFPELVSHVVCGLSEEALFCNTGICWGVGIKRAREEDDGRKCEKRIQVLVRRPWQLTASSRPSPRAAYEALPQAEPPLTFGAKTHLGRRLSHPRCEARSRW